eukprot:1153272-Pelagomonas_calceolata.AAC.1
MAEGVATVAHREGINVRPKDLVAVICAKRQDALPEAMAVCPCWRATRMPASSDLLIVFVGPKEKKRKEESTQAKGRVQ